MPITGGRMLAVRCSMLIRDDHYPHKPMNPANRVSRLFPQVIATMPVSDHRQAFLFYLEFYLAKIGEAGNTIWGEFSNKQVVEAQFFADRRLETIRTKMTS